jgi:hypothetical protein
MNMLRIISFVMVCTCVTIVGDSRIQAGQAEGWQANKKLVQEQAARRSQTVYDEAKVPTYTLPDPLLSSDGTKITDAQTWHSLRRPEILELFRTYVYGHNPVGRPRSMSFTLSEEDKSALDGTATRKQVSIKFTGNGKSLSMDMLIYLPSGAKGPVPVFLLLNFRGNHAISDDPQIKLANIPAKAGVSAQEHTRQLEQTRGQAKKRFPLQQILARGYGLATIYRGDIDPDDYDEFKNGVHGIFDKAQGDKRSPQAWGTIGAWAWGLNRAMDYLVTDKAVDAQRVIVLGHSRLGKTSLWAGAQDKRFAMVISNDSGCGGAALSRRHYGETVKRINTSFPHWFCENFRQYDDNEGALPVDQHQLIALTAPRPVYVASADRDLWADPRGEFLSCVHAEPVYRLLGLKGLGVKTMPSLDQPIQNGHIGYHVRSGGHDLTAYDWEQYMNFAAKHLAKSHNTTR